MADLNWFSEGDGGEGGGVERKPKPAPVYKHI